MSIAFVPENRLCHSAVPELTLSENILISQFPNNNFTKNGIINHSNIDTQTKKVIDQFNVVTPGIDAKASSLSGGNLQKFVIGREILKKPRIFVVNQPTWGVDAAAAAFIRQSILNLASHGSAVVVISQDLDELFEICDTFAVLTNGRLSKSYDMRNLSSEDVGLLMGGSDLDLKNS